MFPWLSIVMAILSALASLKSKPNDKGRAIAAAALGGLGTYYVTHETEWGRENLGKLDGVVTPPPTSGNEVTLPDGSKTGTGNTTVPSTQTGTQTGVWDVMKDWGPTGTAAVIGAAGITATGSWTKLAPWLIGGAVLLMVLK